MISPAPAAKRPPPPTETTAQERRTLLVVTLGFLLWALGAFFTRHGDWADDLAALWFAAHFWAEGAVDLLYAAPPHFFGDTPSEWLAYLAQQAPSGQDVSAFPYIYPPLWAGLLAPLTRIISIGTFFEIARAAELAMLVGAVFLAERIARPDWMSRNLFLVWGLVLLATSLCVSAGLKLLQPSIPTAFLTLLAFALVARMPARAGAVLALAAALKLTPAAFVLIFVLRGQRRAVLGFLIAGAALALASLSMGWPVHRAFVDQLDRAGDYAIWAPMNPSTRILLLQLLEATGLARFLPPVEIVAIPGKPLFLLFMPAWPGALAAVIALALAALAAIRLRHRTGRGVQALALLAMSTGLFLLGPLSWVHYLIVPLLCLPALGFVFDARKTFALMGAATAISSTLFSNLLHGQPLEPLPLSLFHVLLWAGVLTACLIAFGGLPRAPDPTPDPMAD